MRFGLEAKIKDPDLLFSLISELGTTFYKPLGRSMYKIVYFSGNRVITFTGKLSKSQIKQLDINGNKIERMEFDNDNMLVKVEQ